MLPAHKGVAEITVLDIALKGSPDLYAGQDLGWGHKKSSQTELSAAEPQGQPQQLSEVQYWQIQLLLELPLNLGLIGIQGHLAHGASYGQALCAYTLGLVQQLAYQLQGHVGM